MATKAASHTEAHDDDKAKWQAAADDCRTKLAELDADPPEGVGAAPDRPLLKFLLEKLLELLMDKLVTK